MRGVVVTQGTVDIWSASDAPKGNIQFVAPIAYLSDRKKIGAPGAAAQVITVASFISRACVDGLTGFPEAIEAVFPQTTVQLCIVHMVRNSLSYVSYKDRKAVASDLKAIYTAATETEAEQALVDFAERWDKQYPTISKSWFNHWNRIIPFFAFPPDIRKAIYTTNAIESMNMTLRKVLRNHRSFPSDESAMKVIYWAIDHISKKWTMPIRDWKSALNRFAIEFEGRFPM
ncbi:MAG: transposase [Drouetiella hepatica Uher 2000/2452]|uniref:Mutator family transposase n=1 Tax=Drouetiella hepatica Uher 2000/2452 TaxID=904376 RepID=A0A951QGE4_9CYAN|nr:transposase [Drouetiella hepatica Uher 2000/2452]